MLLDQKPVSSLPLKPIIVVLAALVVPVLSLRIYQDDAPLSSFLRFLSRGVLFGVVSAVMFLLVTAFVAVLLHLLWRKPVSRQLISTVAVVGFVAGTFVNTAITWYMTSYDADIGRRMHAAQSLTGFIELRMPHYPPITLKETAGQGHMRRELIQTPIPEFIIDLAESAEDKRFSERIASIDLEAIGRAVFRVADGQREGGSGFPEQLAGLLFDLHPRGLDLDSLRMKAKKFLLGTRIDELYRRKEILRTYLTIAPFNSVAGFQLSGIQAAALTFFDCDTAHLTVSQAALLLIMLPNPSRYFPYQRPQESEVRFSHRIATVRERSNAVINNAAERQKLAGAAAAQARAELMKGLVPYDRMTESLRRPRLRAIFDELHEFVDSGERSLIVEATFDSDAQRMLNAAVESARVDACRLPAVRKHGCDDVEFDVVVALDEGGIIAETGLTTISGGASSIIKPAFAAAALESRLMGSIYDFIPGTRIRLGEMLWHSINEGAERLSEQLGAQRMVPFLPQFGFVIPADRVSTKNALGAGAWIGPRSAARGFVFKFGSPGTTVPVCLVVRILDRSSGETLYRASGTQIISKRTAEAVRSALLDTPIQGTAQSALKDVALTAPIAVKTGTAAFRSAKLKRIVGEGGSWTLAADSLTRTVISVRARYRSGAPFEPNGGISAALVVRNFLTSYREAARHSNPEVNPS